MQSSVLSALAERGWGILHRGELLEYDTPYAFAPLWSGARKPTIPWVRIPELNRVSVARGQAGQRVAKGEEYILNFFIIKHEDLVEIFTPQGIVSLDDTTFIALLKTLPKLSTSP